MLVHVEQIRRARLCAVATVRRGMREAREPHAKSARANVSAGRLGGLRSLGGPRVDLDSEEENPHAQGAGSDERTGVVGLAHVGREGFTAAPHPGHR